MDAYFDEEMNKAKKAPKDEQLDVYKNLCSITVPCKITEKKSFLRIQGAIGCRKVQRVVGWLGMIFKGWDQSFFAVMNRTH